MCPVVVPPGNPIIEARDEVLSEGNETEMTCTAMSSKPAATLRWMKGDKELPGRFSPHTKRKSQSSIRTSLYIIRHSYKVENQRLFLSQYSHIHVLFQSVICTKNTSV